MEARIIRNVMVGTPTPEQSVDAYVAAWNERDAGVRAKLLEAAVTDDCQFVGPTGTFRGREAIEGLVVALQARMGEAIVARTGEIDESLRFRWVLRVNHDVVFEGVDTVEVAGDGRIRCITVETV